MNDQRVKGTRDFIQDALLRENLIDKIKESYSLFGFKPIITPSIEYLSLYKNKAGEEIENQLYSFEDKKGEKLVLRPEHTLSKLRAVNSLQLPKPMKFYSIGNVWRYEDVSKGRYREFIQADIDTYGSEDPFFDAEIIQCIDFTLRKIGINDYTINISSRKIWDEFLEKVNLKDKEKEILRLIDKIDKVGEENVKLELERMNALSVLEFLENKEISKDLLKLFEHLDKLKINYVFNKKIVRGLDYYDSFVFEFISNDLKMSIAGGGRYDSLSKKVFGKELSATGGSIGFERVFELIKSKYKEEFSDQVCVISVGEDKEAIEIANELRLNSIRTNLFLSETNLSKAMDYCNKNMIRFAVIVGRRELSEGTVKLKDLKESKEMNIKKSELLNFLLSK
ncbi:MAG: histidine--tRNA ligase [Candidatus Parvarchaeota archaeon]|nr:histidine--tRNA ligase [Candidatus Rehaiarchaeum fermentans]